MWASVWVWVGLRLEFAFLVFGPWGAVGFLPIDGLLDLFCVLWCGGHGAGDLVVDGLKYRDFWRMKSSPVEYRLSTGLHFTHMDVDELHGLVFLIS